MSDWRFENARMRAAEINCMERARRIQELFFPDKTMQAVRSLIRRDDIKAIPAPAKEPTNSNIYKQAYLLIKTSGATDEDLAAALGVSARVACTIVEDLRADGYNVLTLDGVHTLSRVSVPTSKTIRETWNGDKVIRFGVVSDCHINNEDTQITHLHDIYDTFAREGVEMVYNVGDIDEGEKMRAGQEYELYNHGVDRHVDEIVRVYPYRPGITTRFITGNHDLAFLRNIGCDIGERIAAKRADMEYVGREYAKVMLTDNCSVGLIHPGGGSAYAISYKPQKIAESLSGGGKPNILLIGHYHKAEWFFYRNIHMIQAGCFEAQTPFMQRNQLAAMVGGFIVEVHVSEDGSVNCIVPRFYPYYEMIEKDYLNWRDFPGVAR